MVRMAKTVLELLSRPPEEAREAGSKIAETSEFGEYIKNVLSVLME